MVNLNTCLGPRRSKERIGCCSMVEGWFRMNFRNALRGLREDGGQETWTGGSHSTRAIEWVGSLGLSWM